MYAVWQEMHTCSGLAWFGMACLLCPSNALSPGACLLPALHVVLVHLKGITCRVSWLTLQTYVNERRVIDEHPLAATVTQDMIRQAENH